VTQKLFYISLAKAREVGEQMNECTGGKRDRSDIRRETQKNTCVRSTKIQQEDLYRVAVNAKIST
jgi:hypothetical protein